LNRAVSAPDSTTAIETVFRIEFARLVGALVRLVNDIDLAEELAQDALVDALQQWPREGTPRNPGAWLMTVAKRKAVDRIRRDRTLDAKHAQIAASMEAAILVDDSDVERTVDGDHIEDDRLRLMFVACHPVLSVPSRIALALRLLGGLTTAEIARAFLQPEPTIAQRISRAKKTIAAAAVPFEVPVGDERVERLASVLEVVYLIFNEGYTATAGEDWLRPDLCSEALRLGRLLAALIPDDAEVLGLLALLELQASRLSARLGPDLEPVLLMDQDRGRWDRLSINRGLSALERSRQLTDAPGPYALQAAIAACHARAARPESTDWAEIVALYDLLAIAMPSPIVDLNRAVAVSMATDPAAALVLVDDLGEAGTLDGYHLLHVVRGDLLAKLDRHAEARAAFERAASLATNQRERELSQARAEQSAHLIEGPPPPRS
jgi:RNA polymerase sigma factor (sigma-70 family)